MINYIFDVLDMQLYNCQQQLSILVFSELGNFTPSTFIIFLIAGCVTSMNPCVLSLLPVSISYLYGSSVNVKLANKFMFITGIISSLIVMVFMTSIVSQQYSNLITKIPIFSSIFTICIGLSLLQVINFYDFLPSLDSFYFLSDTQLLHNYTTGLILGFSSTPCSTPIILTILVWLLNVKYWALGFIYLFVYCLGYIIPLIMFINCILNYNQILNVVKSWDYLIPISGSCVLGLGIFSFLQKTFM